MTPSDWCGIASLAATLIIACIQIRQTARMDKFERDLCDRDERRHEEEVRANVAR